MSTAPDISVVIPTYHRPEGVRAAVASVLAQELPAGRTFEVVVALSDPSAAADREAVTALDGVKVAEARRPGPAAARNAGVAASAGELIAFIDDDCVARPGWLTAGLEALAGADLVQGRTVPAGPVGLFEHTLDVYPPSWLWESCNLFVRRAVGESHGWFDEDWNPTGRVGGHMGEDVEWGWRMVRGGARAASTWDAVVEHEVRYIGPAKHLAAVAQLRHFPLLFRVAPEARRHFYRGYFVSRRHAVLAAAAATALAAAVVPGRAPRAALALTAAGLLLSPLRGPLREGDPALVGGFFIQRLPEEAVALAACAYGSVRWRRLLV